MTASERIYLNITNQCNTRCNFCCMYSAPEKMTFLSFNKYVEIINATQGSYELQLEGGEPLLHPDLYLFLEYAKSTKQCAKIIISTNGILLLNHLQRLIDFCNFSNIPVVIKRSINYHLYSLNSRIFHDSRDLYLATEFIPNFEIKFNVRLRKEDTWIVDKLKEFKIYDQSVVYELQNYGRNDNTEYMKPFIVRNINAFRLYATDGTCFNEDLIQRSEYEKTLY